MLPALVSTHRDATSLVMGDVASSRCRDCNARVPDGRLFCYTCGGLPHYQRARRGALLIEGALSARTARQSAPLLHRLLPAMSIEALEAGLSRLPLLIYVETEPERWRRLQWRLEREGLRVRVLESAPLGRVASAVVRSEGRAGLELGGWGLLALAGLSWQPITALGAGALAAGRLWWRTQRSVTQATVTTARMEPECYALWGDRAERIRRELHALREPSIKALAGQALVAYEQAEETLSSGSVAEHLWRPIEPTLVRYLEEVMALAGRIDRLERVLELEHEPARSETKAGKGLEALTMEGLMRVKRDDVAGAVAAMQARLERAVASLRSLRGGLAQLEVLEAGEGAGLDALAAELVREIDGMGRGMRALEALRRGKLRREG